MMCYYLNDHFQGQKFKQRDLKAQEESFEQCPSWES